MQFCSQMLRVLYDCLAVFYEIWLHCLVEGNCLGSVRVYVRTSLDTREYSSVDSFAKFSIVVFVVYQSSSWSAQSLMSSCGYNIEILPRSFELLPCNESSNMCNISHQDRRIFMFFLYFLSNISEFFPVDISRIGRKSCYDQLRLVFQCLFFNLFVINQMIFFCDTVRCYLIENPRYA